jgi:hypothetical protein
MRYSLLIYDVEDRSMSEEERKAEYQKYMDFAQAAAEAGVMAGGHELHAASTATTIRIRDGKTTTVDGPFAETKEILGGLFILELPNLDAAIEWAAKLPAAATGSIEIRQVVGETQN